ncbi:MAG: hypothetical protein ACP5FQ_07535, partial [Thermoplasmata archaeon]
MTSKISIFCVQPLTYTDHIEEEIYIKFVSYRPEEPQNRPDWISELSKLYQKNNYYYILLDRIENIAVKDISSKLTFTSYLLCNNYLNIFLIIFEITSNEEHKEPIETKKIRDMFVLSDNDCRLTIVKSTAEKACKLVARMLNIKNDCVVIRNDTCNISIFIDQEKNGMPVNIDTFYHLLGPDESERTTIKRDVINISDDTTIMFGGRVHIVISNSENDVYVIKNILLNLQVIWFFVPIYLKISSKLHLDIVSGNSNYSVDYLEDKSEVLSYISKTIKLQNETEKLSYEVFKNKLYDRVESSWGIENSISQFEEYSSFFDSFIKNTREKQSKKADEFLNYVLAALAIFGLVGFWADTLHAEMIAHEWKTFGRFIKFATSSLFGLSTIIFVFFGLSLSIAIVYY